MGGTLPARTHRGRAGPGPEPLVAVMLSRSAARPRLGTCSVLGKHGERVEQKELESQSQEGAGLTWRLFVEMFRGDPGPSQES